MTKTTKLMSTREACAYLGKSRKTLATWMRDGIATPDQSGAGPTDAHWWSIATLDKIADARGFVPAGRK